MKSTVKNMVKHGITTAIIALTYFPIIPAAQAADFSAFSQACGIAGYTPSWIPDMNGGAAFHFTFTTGQLITQMKQLCSHAQQVQLMVNDMNTGKARFLNMPLDLTNLLGVANVNPTLAKEAQALSLLSTIHNDAQMLDTAEQLLNAASGRDQNVRAAAMIAAVQASDLQKLLTFEATQVQSTRDADIQAVQTIQKNFSDPSPDFGDGSMI